MKRYINDLNKINTYKGIESISVDQQEKTITKILCFIKFSKKIKLIKSKGYSKNTININLQNYSKNFEFLIEIFKNGSCRVRVTNLFEIKNQNIKKVKYKAMNKANKLSEILIKRDIIVHNPTLRQFEVIKKNKLSYSID